MLLTGLQYQSVLVTLIRFQHVRKSEASFIRISPHNGACFHVENSTRLLLIRYFNHLLCSTFGPTVPLWRVIKRLWSSSGRKNSWHCSGEVGDCSERKPGRSQGWEGPVGLEPGRGWPGASCAHCSTPFNTLWCYCWAKTPLVESTGQISGQVVREARGTCQPGQHCGQLPARGLTEKAWEGSEGFRSIFMVYVALEITDSWEPDWFLWIHRVMVTFSWVFISEENAKFSIPTGVSIGCFEL